MANHTDEMTAPPAEVAALIEERATLRKWLAGLEAQRGVASDRILERVRADYENRLTAVDAALSAHVESVQAELEAAMARAAEAEARQDEALDALEEARLRRTIGELPETGWAEREAELLAAVQLANSADTLARADVERLSEVVSSLAGSDQPSDWAAVSAGLGLDADVTREDGGTSPALTSDDEGPGEFIGGIDAVMAEGGAPPPDPDGVPGPETAPQPGLKCGECGYTNELSAWFCAVCGADVG